MSAELVIPMTSELVWANVMRPRIPLVYLDLYSIVFIARSVKGDRTAPAGYDTLYEAALRAKAEQRAMFPLSGAHLWEISNIPAPVQRADLADVLESLSDYNYMLGRTTIAQLEFEAGMAKVMGEDDSGRGLPLLRPTMGQAFGMVGGLQIRNADGTDGSEAVRAQMGDEEFERHMARMNFELERKTLRGPSSAEELSDLRTDPNYRPEVAVEGQRQRLLFELETERILTEDPKWRRARLRDLIGARELVHEWIELFTRLKLSRTAAGLPAFEPSDEAMRTFIGSMPHTQVAVSLKTKYHKNPRHNWTVNDVVDIDAVSVAYAYCEAVFPDKATRHALMNSKELRVFGTFVPRRPEELTDWLNALPVVVRPEVLVPHPLARHVS